MKKSSRGWQGQQGVVEGRLACESLMLCSPDCSMVFVSGLCRDLSPQTPQISRASLFAESQIHTSAVLFHSVFLYVLKVEWFAFYKNDSVTHHFHCLAALGENMFLFITGSQALLLL